MLNIFRKGHTTLTTDVETWVVRWNKAYGEYSLTHYKEVAQFFTSKEEAKDFVGSLKRAIKLLGHTYHELTWVKCEKVVNNGLWLKLNWPFYSIYRRENGSIREDKRVWRRLENEIRNKSNMDKWKSSPREF